MNLARLLEFRQVDDARGFMNVAQYGDGLPFLIQRFFTIRAPHAPSKRGGYAHRRQSELLICTAGAVTVNVDDRSGKRTYLLRPSPCGVYLPPMTWVEVEFLARSEILVLCDSPFDATDIVHNLRDFNEAHATA